MYKILLLLIIVIWIIYLIFRGEYYCPKCKKRFNEYKKKDHKVWNEVPRRDGSYERAYEEYKYVCPHCENFIKTHKRRL